MGSAILLRRKNFFFTDKMEPPIRSDSEGDLSIMSASTEESWHESDDEFISSSTSDEEDRREVALDEIVDFIWEQFVCSGEVCINDFLLKIKDLLAQRNVCCCEGCI